MRNVAPCPWQRSAFHRLALAFPFPTLDSVNPASRSTLGTDAMAPFLFVVLKLLGRSMLCKDAYHASQSRDTNVVSKLYVLIPPGFLVVKSIE
jgi:hypothetical protein